MNSGTHADSAVLVLTRLRGEEEGAFTHHTSSNCVTRKSLISIEDKLPLGSRSIFLGKTCFL